jgi:hypothetical protein
MSAMVRTTRSARSGGFTGGKVEVDMAQRPPDF